MTFAADLSRFAKKSEKAVDQTVRAITFALFREVVQRTPVGNPDLWKGNEQSASYNKAVSEWNRQVRTKAVEGRISRDRMVHRIGADGYVGGRLKGNWQVSQGAPATGVLETTDASGAKTIANIAAGLGGWGSATFLTNNLPYAEPIEFDGWSSQAPAGMVRVSMSRINQIAATAIRQNKA